jgi:hypothetical protein
VSFICFLMYLYVLRLKLQKLNSHIICSSPKPAQLKCNEIYVSYVTIFVISRLKMEGLQWNLFVNFTWSLLLAVSRYFRFQNFINHLKLNLFWIISKKSVISAQSTNSATNTKRSNSFVQQNIFSLLWECCKNVGFMNGNIVV